MVHKIVWSAAVLVALFGFVLPRLFSAQSTEAVMFGGAVLFGMGYGGLVIAVKKFHAKNKPVEEKE